MESSAAQIVPSALRNYADRKSKEEHDMELAGFVREALRLLARMAGTATMRVMGTPVPYWGGVPRHLLPRARAKTRRRRRRS